MKISTKGRYGIRLMVFLAALAGNKPIPLKEIAKDQEISEKYLEQIINILLKNGFVKSARGAQGGYILGGEPDKIIVGDILRILEGSLSPSVCAEDGCEREGICASAGLWHRVNDAINSVVDNTTLGDLVREYNEKKEKAGVLKLF